MGSVPKRLGSVFLCACAILASSSFARADFIIDDFDAPARIKVPVISLLDPDPTLVETPDAAILGGERDLLLDVIGAATLGSFVGEIGGGVFKFNSSTPGTAATIQYDGSDADVSGPPAALVNSEGLGGIDLTAYGSLFALDFLKIDGGAAQATSIDIEVHSSTGTTLFSDTIPDTPGPTTFSAPFAAFSGPGGFSDVTSIEFRINAGGAENVDFELDTIRVVPEPSTIALLAAGLIGLWGWARRRRRWI